jgi:hypothetical protein
MDIIHFQLVATFSSNYWVLMANTFLTHIYMLYYNTRKLEEARKLCCRY